VPSRLRVPLGYAAGALVLFLARPTSLSLLAGFPLALAGEALRLWAAGHLEKTQRLATGGPYAHTRNPLYLGSMAIGAAVAVASANPWATALTAAYFAALYPPVIRSEARFLRAKFGAEYAAWAQEVPLFLARPTPGGPRATRFAWARVRQNREWRAAIGLPVVAAVLVARGALFP